MSSEEFTCECCEEKFTKGWSEEEAEEEMKKDYPSLKKEDAVKVCQDCYYEIIALHHTIARSDYRH